MKNKKILLILIFAILILFGLTTKSNASLYLDNLDFYAELDKNGNMNVTETWNIDISDTNTLYKTFKMDYKKYSNITNVKVLEVGKGDFIRTNNWAYHIAKNYYFGGKNNEGDFEIAWGVGLDNSSDSRTYKISYTVIDAVTKYNDCSELYWQFLGQDFEVSAKKIKGTIKLPSNANLKEDIKVWGHVATLNGEIYATSTNTIEFDLQKYSGGNFVEVRVAVPNEIFDTVTRTYNKEMLPNIIAEETRWADEANAKRETEKRNKAIFYGFAIAFGGGISLLLLRKTIKYIKILINTPKETPTEEYEYFREKPRKEATPADALFVYNNGVNVSSTSFGNVFSATLLNLSLKGYYKIVAEDDEKGKEQIVIYRTNKDITDLDYEEERIARFVKIAIGVEEKATIKELQKFIKNHPTNVSALISGTGKATEDKNKAIEIYDDKKASEKSKYIGLSVAYFCFAMFGFGFFFPVSIILIINAILLLLINKKISNLSQKGLDEREKWKGLKKYMEDFSLLNEKEIPALELWEEYLVFATVFGIADKVIRQLKMVYPQIEEMGGFNTSSNLYLMSHTNFNTSFCRAINSSIASATSSASSSGGGGGGGFSGGGGGRRPVAVAGGGR